MTLLDKFTNDHPAGTRLMYSDIKKWYQQHKKNPINYLHDHVVYALVIRPLINAGQLIRTEKGLYEVQSISWPSRRDALTSKRDALTSKNVNNQVLNKSEEEPLDEEELDEFDKYLKEQLRRTK